MAYEVIYVCNSINNKNVREGELNILEKHENDLYFEFGENEMNIKKRFYNDKETLNKDFDALMKLKNKEKANELVKKSKEKDLIKPLKEAFLESEKILNKKITKEFLEENVVAEIPVVKEEPKRTRKKYNKKDLF